MKILYAIQGTGNGHISRATDIIPELRKYGQVDILVSGIQSDMELPFPVRYKLYGMSFVFGKTGGVSIFRTIGKLNILRLVKDIYMVPVEEYDLIINDFEPVTAWACKLRKIACIGLSHQAAVLHKKAPSAQNKSWPGRAVLKYYAPCQQNFGFHFKNYGPNIFTPLIRSEVRQATISNNGHYTVYLPAYDDAALIRNLICFPEIQWIVFSKHNAEPFSEKNVSVRRIENDAFIKTMASGAGVLCGAGFEAPAEALYLGKKLMVIPMHAQYEQQCNAAALKDMGISVLPSLHKKHHAIIEHWIHYAAPKQIQFSDYTPAIIEKIIREYYHMTSEDRLINYT